MTPHIMEAVPAKARWDAGCSRHVITRQRFSIPTLASVELLGSTWRCGRVVYRDHRLCIQVWKVLLVSSLKSLTLLSCCCLEQSWLCCGEGLQVMDSVQSRFSLSVVSGVNLWVFVSLSSSSFQDCSLGADLRQWGENKHLFSRESVTLGRFGIKSPGVRIFLSFLIGCEVQDSLSLKATRLTNFSSSFKSVFNHMGLIKKHANAQTATPSEVCGVSLLQFELKSNADVQGWDHQKRLWLSALTSHMSSQLKK